MNCIQIQSKFHLMAGKYLVQLHPSIEKSASTGSKYYSLIIFFTDLKITCVNKLSHRHEFKFGTRQLLHDGMQRLQRLLHREDARSSTYRVLFGNRQMKGHFPLV